MSFRTSRGVRHAVFMVGGAGFDRMDQAIVYARSVNVPVGAPDDETEFRLEWAERPVTPLSGQRVHKKSGYSKRR